MSEPSPAERPHLIRRWLVLALVAGALVRLPGVAWGVNWPGGFTSHHPDEYTHVGNADAVISPLAPHAEPRYPRALGAVTALPFLAWYAAHGQFGGPRVHIPWTIGTGRLVSLAFGLVAILVVFAIGRDALGSRRAGVFAAWLMALGGLHVTYSHFFVADVPAVTLTLLAVWLMWRDLTDCANGHEALRWAAFAAGSAFAFKLFVFALPALLYVTLSRPPRPRRLLHAAIFAVAGVTVSSLGFDTPVTLQQVLANGVSVPHEFSRLRGAFFYLLQLPSILSLPLLVAAVSGTWLLIQRLRATDRPTRRHALVVFGSVPVIASALVVFTVNHFPRHLLFLVPWAALAGGWFLARAADRLAAANRSPAVLVLPVFVWMAAFIVDAERFFVFEPRNAAYRWIEHNVTAGSSVWWAWHRPPAGFRSVRWQVEGNPDVLVMEMHEANLYLSGVGWRDSYPSDPRLVYDGRTAGRVAAVQGLFRGTSEYAVAARFPDSYVMPEYRLTSRLLGDRSRSMISEVVIFRKR